MAFRHLRRLKKLIMMAMMDCNSKNSRADDRKVETADKPNGPAFF